MTTPDKGHEREGEQGPVIRDRRRIDPETGQVRQPPAEGAAAPGAPAEEAPPTAEAPEAGQVAELRERLDERTADLQRLQAEYVNYRRRVERDKAAAREVTVGNVLGDLFPILDDIGRAREHEELTGGFKSVAEALEATVGKLGLEKYGEVGEAFDPNVHEALMHAFSPDVAETSVSAVLQPGYRIGDRVLRPARVAVAEPEAPAGPSEPDEQQ